MTKPCPFCGDTRDASIEEVVMKFDPPNLFVGVCQCCGAQGPSTTTRGAALVMWDHRTLPGHNSQFHELFNRVSP